MAQVLATRIDREVMQALSRAGSPIHSAAYVGNVEALRRELDRGVSANVTINEPIAEDNGLTPLHLLITRWLDLGAPARVACFELLRAAGADMDVATADQGVMPLHYAAVDFNAEGISLLLEAGADPNPTSGHNDIKPIHFLAVLPAILEKVNNPSNPQPTEGDITRCISLLVQAGAAVDARTSDGLTPLEHAVYHGCRITWAGLLRAGAVIPSNLADRDPYLRRVRAAGGYAAYRRRHLDRLTRMFTAPPVPNDGRRRSRRLHRRGGLERLPPEIVMRVVEFWAHVGHY
jgi:ankyrin repeat protein